MTGACDVTASAKKQKKQHKSKTDTGNLNAPGFPLVQNHKTRMIHFKVNLIFTERIPWSNSMTLSLLMCLE